MPYKCLKCGCLSEMKPIEHGTLIVNFVRGNHTEKCDGDVVEISWEEYHEAKRV